MERIVEQWVRPEILAMPVYQVPDATGYIKLDAMENPFRLPEDLRQELGRHLAEVAINRYPDPQGQALKQVMVRQFAIPDAADLLFGNGSDELIGLIIQALARPGAQVMSCEPSFVMYRFYAQMAHADFLSVDLNADFSLNLPRTLAAIQQHQPAVIFLAYPNNPTGNRYAREDVLAILAAAEGLVVVDEAYDAFSDDSLLDLAGQVGNLLVLRTVSKIGLAGIRLGYAVSTPGWIEAINKVRPPYNINALTQMAASFLLQHRGLFDEQIAVLRRERQRMFECLEAFEAIQVFASEANFLTVRVPDAEALFSHLKKSGILVKKLHGAHPLLAQCLRIGLGTSDENDAVLTALLAYFK